MALYDVSSSYFEGRTCPLARFGYDHGTGKRGRMQVEYGLLCDSDGRPVAIEAFEGSLKDDKTLPSQVQKIEQRFGLSRVIVVTDRGIGTNENVTLLSETAKFAFVTALKAPQVRKLVKEGFLQLSMFDQLNLAEIACEKLYPGQRLVVCRNPLVAEQRARTRRELLAATEKQLGEINRGWRRARWQVRPRSGFRSARCGTVTRVKKHFQVNITDDTLTYQRKDEQIAPAAEHADRAASPRARADQRARPPAHVAKTQTASSRRKARKRGESNGGQPQLRPSRVAEVSGSGDAEPDAGPAPRDPLLAARCPLAQLRWREHDPHSGQPRERRGGPRRQARPTVGRAPAAPRSAPGQAPHTARQRGRESPPTQTSGCAIECSHTSR